MLHQDFLHPVRLDPVRARQGGAVLGRAEMQPQVNLGIRFRVKGSGVKGLGV